MNPCAAVVGTLEGVRTSSGALVHSLVLPVEWDRSWPVLRDAIEASKARIVLVFGLHAGAERLRLELDAVNVRELGQADAAGRFPSGPGIEDGPERLSGTLPLSACASALTRAGIPFEVSRDAGRYLCNDTYYHLCRYGSSGRLAAWGFVHTPLTDELLDGWSAAGALPMLCRTISADVLRKAVLCLAEACDPLVA
jgi:pyroglutamyl-peptidase